MKLILFVFIVFLVFISGSPAHAQGPAGAPGLGDALKLLYPTVDPIGGDYRVEDRADGQGPRITKWDAARLGTQPSQAQLEQAIADVAAARTAAATARSQEETVFQAALTKLANNQDLTAAENRAVLRALIRCARAVQATGIAPATATQR